AMESGVWADAGDEAARVVVDDELTLQAKAREILPGMPYIVFGHRWGSMIARSMASRPETELTGLALCGIAAQMMGIEQTIDRAELAVAAAGDHRAEPAADHLVGQLFDGFLDRCGPDAGPTAWVALDEAVVADHGRDPFNNFGAPMSARFLQGFVD
ncbi:alpha/beta hydrolase, partial [Streptococcus pneumoniae]